VASQSLAHLIDDQDPKKGVQVAYMGGAICEGSDNPALNGLPRKVLFRLECGEEDDEKFEIDEPGNMQGTTKCELRFKKKTPYACPDYVATYGLKGQSQGISYRLYHGV